MYYHPIKTLLYIVGITLASLATANSQIVYVQQGASGNGTSWNNATGNLKAALDNATWGTQIWVSAGIYYPVTCTSCNSSDREITFDIPENVQLYGGFAGNESSVGQRNIQANPTILSGDIDQDNTMTNNSYSIIHTQNVTNLTVVDGFIIEAGNADFPNAAAGDFHNSGAAWYNNGSLSSYFSNPVVRNCIFRNHYASGFGAAIYNDGGFGGDCNPVFDNCVFENCTANLGGGAIYNNAIFGGNCSPGFNDCTFTDNNCTLATGGAIANEGAEGGFCNPTFTNCQFTNNFAAVSGGAMYNFGKNGTCNPLVTNTSFVGNQSQAGGAIYSDGSFTGESNGVYSDCNFSNNTCTNGNGGAIYNSGISNGLSSPTYQNCVFFQNESAAAAGAIFNNGSGGTSTPLFSHCIFSENHANEIAGIMYNLGTAQGNASPIITNCTFFGNSAPLSGAVYNNANDANGTANAVITNCIFWANNADLGKVLRNIWSNPTISHSIVDVANCEELNSGNDANLMCGAGMLYNQNPLFADTSVNNFHVLMNSPAINSGNNTAANGIGVDLDGLPRFQDIVDLGVYEFGSTAGTAPIVTMNPQSQAVCQFESVTFAVAATSSQPLTYQWQKDGSNIPGANNPTYTIPVVDITDAGSYHCRISNNLNEVVTTQDAVLTVNELAEVMVEITASATEICAGESVVLSAQVTNGGLLPNYQWMINGNSFGNSIPSFTINSLQNGDQISLMLTSSANCINNPVAFSNDLTFSVGANFEVSVSISTATLDVCQGAATTFSAIPVNGGNLPEYVWYVNSIAQGVNAANFTTSNLNDNDIVQVQLTSSKTCVTTATVLSAPLAVNVLPAVNASLSIDAPVDTAICMGSEITFVANPTNGGNSPSFQWRRNGLPVGMNAPTYTTNDLEDGENIICTMASSAMCAMPSPAISNNLEVMVDSCDVATYEIFPDGRWTVSPNPSDGEFHLILDENFNDLAIEVSDIYGQIVLQDHIKNTQKGVRTKKINIRSTANGTYFIKIQSGNIFAIKKLVLAK